MGKTTSATADGAVWVGFQQGGGDLVHAAAKSFEVLGVEGVCNGAEPVSIKDRRRPLDVTDADILHAVDHALGAAEQDDGKVLYLGTDRAGNILEMVSVTRDDQTRDRNPSAT